MQKWSYEWIPAFMNMQIMMIHIFYSIRTNFCAFLLVLVLVLHALNEYLDSAWIFE